MPSNSQFRLQWLSAKLLLRKSVSTNTLEIESLQGLRIKFDISESFSSVRYRQNKIFVDRCLPAIKLVLNINYTIKNFGKINSDLYLLLAKYLNYQCFLNLDRYSDKLLKIILKLRQNYPIVND